MILRFVIVNLLFLSSFVSTGQSSTQFENYINQGWDSCDIAPYKAMIYADSALKYSIEQADSQAYYEALYLKAYIEGFSFENNGNAISLYEKCAGGFIKLGDSCNVGNSYFNLATCYLSIGSYINSMLYFIEAEKYDKCKVPLGALLQFNMAILYEDIGLNSEAWLKYHAVLAYDSINDETEIIPIARLHLNTQLLKFGDTISVERILANYDTRNYDLNDPDEVDILFAKHESKIELYQAKNLIDSILPVLERMQIISDKYPGPYYAYSKGLLKAEYYLAKNESRLALEELENVEKIIQGKRLLPIKLELVELKKAVYLKQQLYAWAFNEANKQLAIQDTLMSIKVQMDVLSKELKQTKKELSRSRALSQLKDIKLRFRNLAFILLLVILSITIVVGFVFAYQRKKLNEANKKLTIFNEEKDKIIASLSHDLRSPLSAVSGIISLIKEKNIEDFEKEELVQDLNASFLRLHDSLESLLNWAISQMKHVEIEKETVHLGSIFEQAETYIAPSLNQKGLQLNIVQEDALQQLFVDPGQLRLILRNLLSNAVKFSNKGGVITLKSFKKRDLTIIEVADNGVGMDGEALAKIEQGFMLKSYGTHGEKGLGLGLRLVQEYMKLNGGNVFYSSEINKGTTVTLSFSQRI